MTINMTEIATNSTSVLTWFKSTNDALTEGWLFSVILLSLWLILVISFMQSTGNIKKGFAAASFLCFILAVLLRALSLVPNTALFILLILSAVSLAVLWGD